ncbi:uncharacterized protein LOC114517206 [Dendronephthya gigantea]|uniref:uncharacterized protein LOC114517206 n=1 Tax=Dendronephthya gigantea TaxID=151771 RepID=UPI00106971A0|nr:uncharacterized protein LOC114517206 [Dendronephthya gigantea]
MEEEKESTVGETVTEMAVQPTGESIPPELTKADIELETKLSQLKLNWLREGQIKSWQQNHLWDILVRLRFLPIVLTADRESLPASPDTRKPTNSLRFHWKAPDSDDLTVYRFTRALFGLTCSPFLLGGVLNEHLKSWEKRYPALVEEIKGGLYVDDVMEGGDNVEEVKEKKAKTVSIFEDATFHLHKWHSNASELEDTDQSANEGNVGNPETTFAKQQLGTKGTETKILGMGWNKAQDRLSVVVNKERDAASTKREALSQVASVYDPLGLVSPTTLVAKLLYREMCEEQLAWDEELNGSLKRRWKEWYENLPGQYTVPRTLAPHREPTVNHPSRIRGCQ